MADLENRVDKLEERVSSIEITVEKLSQKVDDFIGEMKDFKTEMRQQNEMRAAEIARVDAKIEKLREQREEDNAKHAADIKELNQKIDSKFDNVSKEIRGMAITTILGVGAIVAGVMGFAWAIFSK